ncbi:MAG: efflux RND transporter periplasmic adaptor subunit [Desulfuromonadaceae bacterium]
MTAQHRVDQLDIDGERVPVLKPRRMRKFGMPLFLLALLLAGGGFGLRWVQWDRNHVQTDNAFIEATCVPLSSRVSGTVTRVHIQDNQFVRQGELLLELDENDYHINVRKAEAGVGIAENSTNGEYLKVESSQAVVEIARARLSQTERDLQRSSELFKLGVIARELLDNQTTAKLTAELQLREAEENFKKARAEAGLVTQTGSNAKILLNKALLDEARQQLAYTRITAPFDGYITRKAVASGANIQAGQSLLALVSLQDAWITANYKEGQLGRITPGQNVSFTVDAYPGRTFRGRVDSIMAGAGSAFSMLPPENATGNFVKVVQRIPVKIAIDKGSDPAHQLRVGMSVIPTITVAQ